MSIRWPLLLGIALAPWCAIVLCGCSFEQAPAVTTGQADRQGRLAEDVTLSQSDFDNWEARYGATPFWSELKKAFPEEHRALIEQMMRISQSGLDEYEIAVRAREVVTAFSQRHVADALAAPDAALVRLLANVLHMHQKIRATNDPAFCDYFAINGPKDERSKALLADEIARDRGLTVSAMGQGHKTPSGVTAPTEADYKLLLAEMRRNGLSDADMSRATGSNPPAGLPCRYREQLLQSVITIPGPPGQRLRSELTEDLLTNNFFRS